MRLAVDLADLYPGEPRDKVASAAARFTLEEAEGPADPTFERAFSALDAYFGPLGEIERRAVHERLAAAPRHERPPFRMHYHLVLARDERGEVAGARDCTAALCVETRTCVVYLAHALVLPPYRRSGLAALLRLIPAQLGRELIREAGLDPAEVDLVLALEQEPVDPASLDSVVRLCAYGRAGYSVIDPAALPYCQPDFRDLEALGVPASPIPLMAVVRRVGREREAGLPARLAAAFVTHLYDGIHGSHCRAEDLAPARRFALEALAASGLAEVPLLPLPASPDDAPALARLHRDRILPLYEPLLTSVTSAERRA